MRLVSLFAFLAVFSVVSSLSIPVHRDIAAHLGTSTASTLQARSPVHVTFHSGTKGRLRSLKIRPNTANHAHVTRWHESAVKAHVAQHFPEAHQVTIRKLVHQYGSNDPQPHIVVMMKKANGKKIMNDKNGVWHHVPVDAAHIPQPYMDALAAKGHVL
ncbi:unnamed protein product [Cyclocybe aegerita]|uniref:Uncharacterized protein n=1 Tax=Cyclocybe aegerita TaxID=1973307 RepID=A0A8S0VXT3_CYCAE|nr:unnamed protein product [Cyclocybe aegerita]